MPEQVPPKYPLSTSQHHFYRAQKSGILLLVLKIAAIVGVAIVQVKAGDRDTIAIAAVAGENCTVNATEHTGPLEAVDFSSSGCGSSHVESGCGNHLCDGGQSDYEDEGLHECWTVRL